MGVVAVTTGRHFIGIEREAEYCEIARARISKAEQKIMGQLNLG
jgi:DNA modification methylase